MMNYTIIDFYKDILEMNNLVGNDHLSKCEKLIEKYTKLTKEESGESLEAALERDHVLLLDGMVDTLVVGYFLSRVQNNENVNKLNLHFKDKKDYFTQYINFLLKVHQNNNFLENVNEIIQFTEYGMNYLNFNFNGAFKEVMASNLSKFPLVSECDDPQSEVEYITNNSKGRYEGIHFTVEGDRYVFWNQNKKFLKPSCFIEPELKPFVNGENIINDVFDNLNITEIEQVVSKLKQEKTI